MLPFHEYRAAGLSVLPVGLDKRPKIGAWTGLQNQLPSEFEIDSWLDCDYPGIAIIAGAISGNLVCVDVDTKHDSQGTVFQELCALIQEWGYSEALQKCVMERTPSGGWHILFRAPFVVGCEKLCRDKGKTEAMIETKGEGGYFVCAPTPGWELKHGSLTDIPTLSEAESNAILAACWALDRNEPENDTPEQPLQSNQTARNTATSQDITPLDDFSSRTDYSALEGLLSEYGWRRVGQRGQNIHLCRPGKGGRDTSATLHMEKNVFFVHSSSTEFQERKGYGPAGVYAILKHRGDFKAAAKALYAEGYGTRALTNQNGLTQKRDENFGFEVKREKLLLDMNALDAEIFEAYEKPEDKGLDSEWPNLDFRLADNQMTVVTGWPSSGKSTFIQSMAVHYAKTHGWRWAIASMEDYPNRRLGGKLIRKYARKPMYGPRAMSRDEYKAAWEWVKKHFIFVNAAADNITVTRILEECKEANKAQRINGLILDPWSEMDEDRPANTIHTIILAHPTKPSRGKSGEYHALNMYDIAGSHHWRAKADNGLIVRRDFDTNITTVDIPKVKFASYGTIGATANFKFDLPTVCYSPLTTSEDFMGKPEQTEETGEAWWDK